MRFHADLHVHSRFSRATSRDLNLAALSQAAQQKGLAVVGTGDFTHPGWLAELREQLVPAEPGLFRLRPERERKVAEVVPPACRRPTRFMLQVEISTIYKAGERTRKVHHLVYAPDLETAGRLREKLETIGNLASDGRPILGLDSRDLLEIVLESGDGAYLVPAHVWTPWFAVLGSKSGFDSIEECYRDLASHVFAVETGLSSDPAMNWRVASLDRFRLVSSSDAHSAGKLGREATLYDTDLDYFAVRRALETGDGYVGTVEFFPEEGKYHLDGHRKCGLALDPAETLRQQGRCPECGGPLTVGVLHRVHALADRPEGAPPPPTAGDVQSLVPLVEVLSELEGVGAGSKRVARRYQALVQGLGPEAFVLEEAPLDEVARVGSPLLAEALARLRRGEVIRQAGYDGEYGVIRLFEPEELERRVVGGLLFPLPPIEAGRTGPRRDLAPAEEGADGEGAGAPETARSGEWPPRRRRVRRRRSRPPPPSGPLGGLDPEQREVVRWSEGPLLVVAGPGSGKTRALTHRLAHLVEERGADPESCLAVTFTRRAAGEMRTRLEGLVPGRAARLRVHTFHQLGLEILRGRGERVDVPADFRVADEATTLRVLAEELELGPVAARRLFGRISRALRTGGAEDDAELHATLDAYRAGMARRGLVDFDGLIRLAADVLEVDEELRDAYRRGHLLVDEYQDLDAAQYRLVRLLTRPDGDVCVIGDPDQAVYGFRGADVGFFHRFREDFPGARVIELGRNYRAGSTLVAASRQALAASGEPGRELCATREDPRRVVVHAAASDAAEAEFVVHTLEKLLGGHSFFSIDSGRTGDGGDEFGELSFSDVAVLYRTDAQADLLEEALARSGMPFQRRSHRPLGARRGVREILRRLREDGWVGALAVRIHQFMETLAGGGAASEEHEEDGEERIPLEELCRDAARLLPLAEGAQDELERLESEVALVTDVDTWDPRADRVSLLTLHASKGLEFPVVFLVGCEDGLLPLRFGGRVDDLDEERRLFYVGMTRAARRLYLCHAARRKLRGELCEQEPSPFLAPIREELLERSRTEMPAQDEGPDVVQLKLF